MLNRLRQGLGKTRNMFVEKIMGVFSGRSAIDEDMLEELEAILIEADLGVETTMAIVEQIKTKARENGASTPEDVIGLLRGELVAILEEGDHELRQKEGDLPHVILVAGVNGSGKTTTVGKLAARYLQNNRSVVMGAADTFRAAASEQLTVWSERTGASIVKHQEGADPSAVAYDAADSAMSRNTDILIVDTAGRLHTKIHLMEELKKIQRVVGKKIPGAPHEVLLVLDATTGQNGLEQAKHFTEALNVSGIVLTKLDGTAKGGIAVAIQKILHIPIKMIGVGEGVEDLQTFDAREFVEAMLPSGRGG